MPEATRTPTTNPDAFIQSLLAPLPADAEPAFASECRRSMRKAWDRTMCTYLVCYHLSEAYGLLSDDVLDDLSKIDVAFFNGWGVNTRPRTWVATVVRPIYGLVDRLMRMPAPNKEALRWKKVNAKEFGMKPEWHAAIAADEARLARWSNPRKGGRS